MDHRLGRDAEVEGGDRRGKDIPSIMIGWGIDHHRLTYADVGSSNGQRRTRLVFNGDRE